MKAVVGSVGLLVLAFVLDWQFKDYWHQSGAEVIVFVQTHFRSKALDVFFWGLSEGSIVAVFVLVLARFFDSSAQDSFKTFMCTFVSIWTTDVLKNSFRDPRPYWSYEAVEPVRCSSGWGNPSGHAMMITSVAAYQCWLLLKEYPQVNRLYIWVLGFISFFLVEFDRIYLGVHFYSQLALGTLMAFTVVTIFISLDQHLNRLFVLVRDDLKWALGMQVPALLMCVVTYCVFSLHEETWKPEWSDLIRSKCNSEKFGVYCSTTSLLTSSVGVLPFALCGIYNYLQRQLTMNWWVDLPLFKRLARLLIASLGLLGIFMLRTLLMDFVDNVSYAFIVSVVFNYFAAFTVLVGTLVSTESIKLTSRGDRKTSADFAYELVLKTSAKGRDRSPAVGHRDPKGSSSKHTSPPTR
jgi:membrane-associated phospholipid phosphatase